MDDLEMTLSDKESKPLSDDIDNTMLLSLITSRDVNSCRKYFAQKPFCQHRCDFKFLDTAIKTCDPEMIDYILSVVSEVYDALCYNIGEVDIVFMATNQMYHEFYRLTLYMAHVKPDYTNDFVLKLTKCRSQITDTFMLPMIDITLNFLRDCKEISRD